MTESTSSTSRYFDQCDESHGIFIDATGLLHHEKTEWQDIKILNTKVHGKVMLLDDVLMLTESTHHVYHEHMVHIPLACLDAPEAVLVIGGGDGGSVTELVKYPGLKKIVLAELDGRVVEISREHLPELTSGLDDPRVDVRIGDGAAYLAENRAAFDCVIIDSTDICEDAHDGGDIASPLASDAFYDSLKAALKPGGVAMQMLGSPTFYKAGMTKLFHRLGDIWPQFKPVMMPCPFYISGDWCAGLMSVDGDLTPRSHHGLSAPLRYYNGDIALGALALPNEIKAMMPG